jgi:hypothetical protein
MCRNIWARVDVVNIAPGRCDSAPLVNGLTEAELGCIDRRMPRMQVYLPDELYRLVKSRRLPASELLQSAVRAEVRRRDLLAETERYLADLVAQVGEPSSTDRARARAVAGRIARRARRKAS